MTICAPAAELIGIAAAEALRAELETWPKPGLVSLEDNGAHTDMNAATFVASIKALAPYFVDFARAGRGDFETLRAIGIEAEAAMMRATRGINTHRGAIFGLGLLCAAQGRRDTPADGRASSLGRIVAENWGAAIAAMPRARASNGSIAMRRYRAGGARAEARAGFPSVYGVGLPALRAARASGADENACRVASCFALVASVTDTNLLHRGGRPGAARAKTLARRFLETGGVASPGWQRRARQVHETFVAHRLSPGGAADLLAMTIFVDRIERRG